jgi:hypothetical protein
MVCSALIPTTHAQEPTTLYTFTSSKGAKMKAFFVRREKEKVVLRSEAGQEKSFAIAVFSPESKQQLIDLILESKSHSEEVKEFQKRLIGLWNTTDGSGFTVAFDNQWRVPLWGVRFPNGGMFGDTTGFAVYDIDLTQDKPVIRIFRWEENGDEPDDEWVVQSIEGDKMKLLGVERKVQEATALDRIDPKTVPAPFTRVDPTPPEPSLPQ